MRCPKCGSPMRGVTVEQIEVDRCTSCAGLWFDLREHEHLKSRPGAAAIDTGDPASGAEMSTVRDADCPRCGVRMVKLAFADQPHIEYEQCATCGGVFLDAGEFADFSQLTLRERVRRFFGGLG